jgi:glycosyltransferase involved in cell wall biosynthesis
MLPATRRPWHIIHSESEIGWGGQEHRVLAELSGFQRRGCRVGLLAPAHSGLAQRAAPAGIAVRHWRVAKLLYPLTVAQTALWLRRERPDVLNTHSSRDSWLAGIAGRLARVPLIIRTRHFEVGIPHRWLSGHVYTSLADHVLTTSQNITNHFRDYFGLPADRVTTVPTGIDLERFRADGPKASLSVLGEGGPLVGMVSVLRSWKGHPTFFKAARIIHDSGRRVRFVVVGGGAPPGAIEKQAQDHGASGLIAFPGHREDVPEVLRALGVLAIPSTANEGVPQIGLQALACQTPVVGSNVGGIPEIIRHAETGRLVPPGDAPALATAILETLDDPEATRALTRRGRELVTAKHSLEVMLDTLDVLYRRYLPK